MKIRQVESLLSDHGLEAPKLNALIADVNNYSLLLSQPQGQIEATQDGIRNRDQVAAEAQFNGFLKRAVSTAADLIVTPEYSMPWSVLRPVLAGKSEGPANGKLWALGCESVKYEELQKIRDDAKGEVTILFETIEPDNSKFVDPLVYLFLSTEIEGNGQSRLVAIIQFKTHAMADPTEFEKNKIQLGQTAYQFQGQSNGIRLISFICSDAFAVSDEIANNVYDRSLILHLQLNPEPRHPTFLACREKLLKFSGDATELLCLNWASKVNFFIEDECKSWENIAGSAWYGKMKDFDLSDAALSQNHRRGLYYTRLEPHRTHALFLNFNPAIYLLNASKVVRLGVPGPVGPRRGPQLERIWSWDSTATNWNTIEESDDEFLTLISNCAGATEQGAMLRSCVREPNKSGVS